MRPAPCRRLATSANIATPCQYQVFVRQGLAPYGENPPRATNSPFTINHADGSTTVAVNHFVNQASWVSLGTYSFNAGSTGNITVSDAANGRVVADAVRLVPLPYASAATWAAPVAQAGSYRLYLRYPQGFDLARDAKVFVTHAGGESVVYVDQREDGGAQWRYLGTWTFTPGAGHKATLPAGPVTNGLTADAMAWVSAGATIDADRVAWNPAAAGVAAGSYVVEVNWLRYASLGYAPGATFSIVHAGGTSSVSVNPASPNAGSWQWQSLGTFTFNDPAHGVTLPTAGMDTVAVAADALRLTASAPPAGSPTVTLTSPTATQTFTAPATISLAATATPAVTPATIQSVQSFNGGTLVGTGTLSAGVWTATWSNVAAGTYSIVAEATDSTGNVGKSATRTITVNAASGGTITPGVYFVETDHLGTPRLVSNMAQQVVWRMPAGEPFGDSPPQDNPAGLGVFEFNLRFPGQYRDRESNLNYNWHREYDPQVGRYVQSDPIGLAGGINTYTYVGGNPVSYVDPTGEIAVVPVVIGLGAGYLFDYLLEKYRKENCTCESTNFGAAGNAGTGGAIGATGPFTSKPRTGIAGGGPSGSATSTVSQINHAAAARGLISIPIRNAITSVARRVPFAGAALAGYELYDAFTCD